LIIKKAFSYKLELIALIHLFLVDFTGFTTVAMMAQKLIVHSAMRGAEIPVAAEMRFLLSKESAVGSKWTYKKMRKQAVMPTASPRIFTKENILCLLKFLEAVFK